MDLWSQISTLVVGKVEKKNLFQKLVPIFQTFWQPFGRMCMLNLDVQNDFQWADLEIDF